MRDIFALATMLEVFLWLTALYLLIRKTVAFRLAALSYAIIILFAAASAAIQMLFLFASWKYSWVLDLILIPYVILAIVRNRSTLQSDVMHARAMLARAPLLATMFGAMLTYLLMQAVLLPPTNADSHAYNLARLLIYQNENSLWPEQNTSCLHQLVFPYGYDILHFVFLRFYSDLGLGLFGFLSYAAILASTYAITQQYFASRRLSLLTTLVIGSLTDLVLQATNTKNDLPCAALASVAFLAVLSWRQTRQPFHLMIALVCVSFGVIVKSYFAMFALPYSALIFWWMCRHHELRCSLRPGLVVRHWPVLSLVVLLGVVAGVFFIRCHVRYGHPFGPEAFRKGGMNAGGIAGGALNAARYLAQITSWPRLLGGDRLTQLHDQLLGDNRSLGVAAGERVDLAGPQRAVMPQEDLSWYGPLGLLIILPAVVAGLFKPGTVRSIALTILCFSGLLCLTLGWALTYGRYFAISFGASGLCVASFLAPIVHKQRACRLLCAASVLLCIGTITLNLSKPLVDVYRVAAILEKKAGVHLLREDISTHPTKPLMFPAWWPYIHHRSLLYDEMFSPELMSAFMKLEPNKNVLVACQGEPLFPFLLKRPDLAMHIRPDVDNPAAMELAAQKAACEYILCLHRVPVEQFVFYSPIGQGNLTNTNAPFAVLLERNVK